MQRVYIPTELPFLHATVGGWALSLSVEPFLVFVKCDNWLEDGQTQTTTWGGKKNQLHTTATAAAAAAASTGK